MKTPTFYDTASRSLQVFTPRDPAGRKVGIYVCGPTVYDRIHVGNARPLVIFDSLVRYLRYIYPEVTYVRNITDVDDKINKRALLRGITIDELTESTISYFHADATALNCLPPDHEPRATQYIRHMINHISQLLANGHAYQAEGHVLFAVESFADYGKFANLNQEELIAGARVEIAPYKKNPADFVLWKPSLEKEPGWVSPFGFGRPGWHIECSAMSSHLLGDDFDIHGGGLDLIFPHHQNEIAQSVCVHPTNQQQGRFARYWLHNGFLVNGGEKMAKSAGNFFTVCELLKQYNGEVIRLVLLQTHYRQPLEFSEDRLEQAQTDMDGFYRLLSDWAELLPTLLETNQAKSVDMDEDFLDALAQDFNTPLALKWLHAKANQLRQILSSANTITQLSSPELDELYGFIRAANILGLLETPLKQWFQGKASDNLKSWVEERIKKRLEARHNLNFALADAIRAELANKGIILEDKPGGITQWRYLH